MKRFLIGAIAAAGAMAALAGEASALSFDRGVTGTDLVEQAQCRMVRERIERPNGSVVYRTSRRCGPGPMMGMRPRMERCRMVRERVERPNGNVVIRNVRRCG